MILVTTGTNAPPFDRLLQEVDRMGLDEHFVVQHGPSKIRPRDATCVDYVSFNRFVELVQEARIVVTHAGVGSILVTLMNGKRPVVVPRRAELGEHVDNHQLELGRRLAGLDVVTLVERTDQLEGVLRAEATTRLPETNGKPRQLAADLGEYLRAILDRPAELTSANPPVGRR